MRKEKTVEVIDHPVKEDKYILIAKQPDGQRIAFEVDQKGK